MLKMEPVHVIRHKYYNEKMSIRQIAREMGADRKTVRKYLGQPTPVRDVRVARERPIMAAAGPQIEAVLGEWNKRLEGKHRLTSPRLHRHLHEAGVKVGERTVRRYLEENERELTDRFHALSSHYIFEPCFARPGEGHDKGGVEGRGKTIRLQHLTPILEGKNLGELSEKVLEDVERQWTGKVLKDGRRCEDLFREERAQLRCLPPVPFEARAPHPASVSNSSTVTVVGAVYSVPEQWARLDVMAYVGPDDIRFVCRGETVMRERSLSGHRQIRYRDYLGALSRKPQAVRQVAPELVGELGEPYGPLWALRVQTHGDRQGARHLAGILGAIREHGEERVKTALTEALAEGRCDLLALRRFIPAAEVLAEERVPEGLRLIQVEAAQASDYDALLVNGGGL